MSKRAKRRKKKRVAAAKDVRCSDCGGWTKKKNARAFWAYQGTVIKRRCQECHAKYLHRRGDGLCTSEAISRVLGMS